MARRDCDLRGHNQTPFSKRTNNSASRDYLLGLRGGRAHQDQPDRPTYRFIRAALPGMRWAFSIPARTDLIAKVKSQYDLCLRSPPDPRAVPATVGAGERRWTSPSRSFQQRRFRGGNAPGVKQAVLNVWWIRLIGVVLKTSISKHDERPMPTTTITTNNRCPAEKPKIEAMPPPQNRHARVHVPRRLLSSLPCVVRSYILASPRPSLTRAYRRGPRTMPHGGPARNGMSGMPAEYAQEFTLNVTVRARWHGQLPLRGNSRRPG